MRGDTGSAEQDRLLRRRYLMKSTGFASDFMHTSPKLAGC
jgi:hypothetical protein